MHASTAFFVHSANAIVLGFRPVDDDTAPGTGDTLSPSHFHSRMHALLLDAMLIPT